MSGGSRRPQPNTMQIINLPNNLLLIRQVHKRPFPASLEFYAYKYRDEDYHLYTVTTPVSIYLHWAGAVGGTHDEITTQKRHNMKPAPERGTIRNHKNENAACECRIRQKGLSAAAVGVVCWMFCAPAADEGDAFAFEGSAVG